MPKMIVCLWAFLFFIAPLEAAEIKDLNVNVHDNRIMVSSTLLLDKEQIEAIRNGGSKEIIFNFDLFRGWRIWPDEFILGMTYTQTLQCDPVKKEYIARSLSGIKMKEKRFSSCEDLLQWALKIPEFQLMNATELEPAVYKVKVRVESRLRRLPPFIDLLFFFVRETEFNEEKDSAYFRIEALQ